MNIKHSTLAAAVTAALAMGAASQATANVYAVSTLDLQNLSVGIFLIDPATGAPVAAPQPVTSFLFTATNTATLNGSSAVVGTGGTGAGAGLLTQSCGGTPGTPPAGNDCNLVTPRLDPGAANAPGSTIVRSNNDFTLFGPGTDTYSNSDSVIYESQLTLDGTTHIQQIAESELQGNGSARANAEITSATGFIMTFTIDGSGGMAISFDADPYLRVYINDPAFDNGTAQANLNASFTLTNEGGDSISWAPQGTAYNPLTGFGNDCVAEFGTCVETADTQDLNRNPSISSNPRDVEYSPLVGFTNFGILITGLSSGDYTLAFNAVTSTVIRRVPEPGVLALLGMGLLGMGVASRRRKVNA